MFKNIEASNKIIDQSKLAPEVSEMLKRNAQQVMNNKYNDFCQSVEI